MTELTNEERNYERTHAPYGRIFLFLAGFTVLEVLVSYLSPGIKIPILFALAIIKATLVVLYFMHLKMDSRLYAMFFVIGMVLAVPIILIMTTVMPFF